MLTHSLCFDVPSSLTHCTFAHSQTYHPHSLIHTHITHTCAHTHNTQHIHTSYTMQSFSTIHLKGEDVLNLRETVVELIEPTSPAQGAPLKFVATLALSLNIQAKAKNARNVSQLVAQVSLALRTVEVPLLLLYHCLVL